MTTETNCPLCERPFTRAVLRDKLYSIRACEHCGLAATLPASFVASPEYSETPEYSEAVAGQESKWSQYARHIIKSVHPYMPAGRLLDVGCSLGFLVAAAQLAGYDAEGIDLDSNAVLRAQQADRPVFRSSVENWDRGDYDVICLSHTLEHVPNPVGFLSACASHLKENGCLLVIIPCFVGLHPQLYRKRWYGWAPWQHFFHYTPVALRRLFEKAGLESLSVWQESMDHRPPIGYMRRRDIPKALVSQFIASAGGVIGLGDQLVGVARKPALRIDRDPSMMEA